MRSFLCNLLLALPRPRLGVAAVLFSACWLLSTPAAGERRIATRSGHPEILLLNRDVTDARGQMAYVCTKIGWAVRKEQSGNNLTCDVPATNKVSVLNFGATAALDIGSWTKVDVRRIVRFSFAPWQRGVIVRAWAERMIPAANNMFSFERQPIDDPETFNGLLNVMALTGNATFAPGTTFAKIGYLGFRSSRFAKVDLDGRERTAIQIGFIEAGSPAEEAGLKVGDLILAMNNRQFDDYEAVSRYLAKLAPGMPVTMLIERAGVRMEVKTKVTAPPPVASG